MRLDLHLHSRMSDGTESPEAVVEAALAARLDVISLTDHDTVAGVARARERAHGELIDVIPGIEVSAMGEAGEFHILGYYVDLENPELVAHGEWAQGRRQARMEEMVDRLRSAGLDITMEQVLEEAGNDAGSLARPHLARAMVTAGIVGDDREAFDRWIGNEQEAYVPARLLTPEESIELIHGAEGIAVWAHPPENQMDERLPALVEAGLDGIEAFRPNHSRDRTRRMEARARKLGLMVTGGSDWHGPHGLPLGTFHVDSGDVQRFLEAGGR